MTRRIPLDGTWQLAFFPEGTHPVANPDDLRRLDIEAIEARVPGNVELDLVRAGLLPEPFVGENILELADCEHCEWWYRRVFRTDETATAGRAILHFEGLDCFATVWVNGECVGRAANMLIPHEFDVTRVLHAVGSENEIVIRIRSAVRVAAEQTHDPFIHTLPTNLESARVRKAPHMYGWDIAPRAVSAGIWRSAWIELRPPLTLGDLYVFTRSADERHATLGFHWQLRVTDRADWRGAQLHIEGRCGDSRFEQTLACRFAAGQTTIEIDEPRLWWPKGYGEPALYDVACRLERDGETLDERSLRVGIRTLELIRTDITRPEEPGEFLFKVNATPILVKGANWVPADAFHSRDAERVPRILALFDDLGCSMVRCWGGNVYEDHPFFDFCDAHGILVWQDFAMACARYPQDEAFLAGLRTEAEAIVRRLRNHPSLALWSGDNECDEVHLWAGRFDPNLNRATREVLPQVVRRCDPWRPYLPSSPYMAPEVFATGDHSLMPEDHLWGPRGYYKAPFYTESAAHFISEIGYHGCPAVDSLEEFLFPDTLWPWADNEGWRIHAADTTPEPGPYAYRIELMAKQIRTLFGADAETLEDFVLASQIVQAEAKKFFIERVRLGKWRRTGILWWNVMDCWPQFSDAIVDYYFRRKLAYLYIRRAQRPACIMVAEPEGGACRVVLGNDSREPAEGRFTVRDADTEEALLEGEAHAGPNENRDLGTIPTGDGGHRLFLIAWELNGEEGSNHYLLGDPPFDLAQYRAWLPRLGAPSPGTLVAKGL